MPPVPKPKTPKQWLKVFDCGREVLDTKNVKGRHEYRRRTIEMYERQRGICAECGMAMLLEDATFEHVAGRGTGSGKWGGHTRDDRIEVMIDGEVVWLNECLHAWCNSARKIRNFHLDTQGVAEESTSSDTSWIDRRLQEWRQKNTKGVVKCAR